MFKKIPLICLLSVFGLFIPNIVSAKPLNALTQQQLLSEVTHYVNQQVNPDQNKNIRVNALPLDSRIRVQTCASDLQFELATHRSYSRQFPVKVSCEDKLDPWKLFVQVKIKEYIEALVTTTHIPKGETVTEDMVKIALVDKHRVKNRSTSTKSVLIGGRAMRNIQRGYQIGSQDVCLVCKGDDVAIIAQNNNMTIKASGTAIENGSFGESIKVKNNSSDRIVKGVIGELRQIFVKL